MKPERRVELTLVEVEYWACRDDSHRHTTEDIAAKCIAAWNRPKLPQRRVWTEKMMEDVKVSRDAGETYVSIAKSYGVGDERISQVLAKYRRILAHREYQLRQYADSIARCNPPTPYPTSSYSPLDNPNQ